MNSTALKKETPASHTSSDWKYIVETETRYDSRTGEKHVATTHWVKREKDRLNAIIANQYDIDMGKDVASLGALIAAAPEMLIELEATYAVLNRAKECIPSTKHELLGDALKQLRALRALIAKAGGAK